MLRSVKELVGYSIEGSDGSMGRVRDALFDDEGWAVRYLLVDSGGWLSRREVLISPMAVERMDWAARLVRLRLTRAQVEHSPDLDSHTPVSRQHELDYATYYGWPQYWGGAALCGIALTPSALMDAQAALGGAAAEAAPGERHLQSARDVIGYRIAATDGDIGHVEDFIVEDDSWALRYVVVDTRDWLPGRKVLVAIQYIREVRWSDAAAVVDLSREAIEGSPAFDPSTPVNRELEVQLYDYYGRPHG
jgi:hypothetical protein